MTLRQIAGRRSAAAGRRVAAALVRRAAGLRVLAALLLMFCAAACALTPGEVDDIVTAANGRHKIVMTADGPVIGIAAPQGEAFLGLPYAAPPVGSLRWHAPEPPVRWSEPKAAFTLGPGCLQNLSLDAQSGRKSEGPLIGAEDCLTLNVYAPGGTSAGDRRPVMVWIYGGAFMLGSSGQYDPSVLARRTGVIVVTFNYRLGALGFLAHPALHGEAGEGAYALLDQQAALRWVKANIANFGGDPAAVTLFGQSAGAWSICDQLASPAAAGLFDRAILQSGSCTAPESSLSLEAAEVGGRHFAADLGCPGQEAIDCLRRIPAQEILHALPERDGVVGPNSWSPAHGGPLLPRAPRQAFESGAFNAVPVIVGSTHDEGRLFSFILGLRGELGTAQAYAETLAHLFGAQAGRVLAQYPAERFGSPGLAYAAVLTDSYFACSALTLDRLLAGRVAVHAYEFDDPAAAFRVPRLPWSESLGAFHTAEIAYVFQTPWVLADPADFDVSQRGLSDAIQAYWGRFARTGDPDGGSGPAWHRFTTTQPVIEALRPGAIAPAADFAGVHRCAFWSSLGY